MTVSTPGRIYPDRESTVSGDWYHGEERQPVYSGYDQDDVILVPLKTGAMRLFGAASLSGLTVLTETSDYLSQTEDELRAMLKHRHGTVDFEISNSTEMLENMDRAMSVTTLILGAIGGISLLVGGIGIMNIMLVSVTERTWKSASAWPRARGKATSWSSFWWSRLLFQVGWGYRRYLWYECGLPAGSRLPHIAYGLYRFSCADRVFLRCGNRRFSKVSAPARNAARLDPVVALATD